MFVTQLWLLKDDILLTCNKSLACIMYRKLKLPAYIPSVSTPAPLLCSLYVVLKNNVDRYKVEMVIVCVVLVYQVCRLSPLSTGGEGGGSFPLHLDLLHGFIRHTIGQLRQPLRNFSATPPPPPTPLPFSSVSKFSSLLIWAWSVSNIKIHIRHT